MIYDLVFAALCDLFRLIDAIVRAADLLALYCGRFTWPVE